MNKFDFYQDVKVTVWQRQHFTIEAETAEEARELAKQYADKDISTCDEVEADEIEWLYDTEEHITPEENGGCATIEVYEREGKYKGALIADNALKGFSAMQLMYPREFNKNEQVAVSENYGEGYFAIVEVEQHADDGEDVIGLYPIGEDGKCSLPPRQVKAKYVYQKAEGKVCPDCGNTLYVECNTGEIDYAFYCPECQGSFFDNEVQ